PDLTYLNKEKIVISVVDERWRLAQGKATKEMGVAHAVFGIPAAVYTYPWYVDKEHKEQTLAEAIEERIVLGLNDEGWDASPAGITASPSEEEIVKIIKDKGAKNLMVMVLKDWWVDFNTNWVSDFNFDWDVVVDIYDESGQSVGRYAEGGRDIVKESASDSWPNMFRRAFRERLIKILEQPDLAKALGSGTSQP
ncbi:MAG TPA: hypothetical protein VK995_03615, partial [Oceanipulchritudo sp.]|nr:hypothetical protein [Oceanipulchritudo sp.]